jgi:uncharacterized protein YjbI with pentapeptide repeats
VLQFLYESHLLDKDKLIIHLEGASLSRALLLKANLKEANLSGASFLETLFIGANLSGAFFINCSFSDANLQEADLTNASFLVKTDLFRANLSGTNMSGAYI